LLVNLVNIWRTESTTGTMSFFARILCGVSDHRWGDWEYGTTGSCQQHRVCQRCSSTDAGPLVHELGEPVYSAEDSCDRYRPCTRCEHVQPSETGHAWGPLEYVSESSCRQEKECVRCHQTRDGVPAHVWGPWEHAKADSCNRARTCARCRELETAPATDTDHDWMRGIAKTVGRTYHPVSGTHLVSSDEEILFTCRRCGQTKTECETWEYVDGY
jgi:hypothetical protein